MQYFKKHKEKCKEDVNVKKLIHVIMYYKEDEYNKVIKILNELQLNNDEKIILINASGNNKLDS